MKCSARPVACVEGGGGPGVAAHIPVGSSGQALSGVCMYVCVCVRAPVCIYIHTHARTHTRRHIY